MQVCCLSRSVVDGVIIHNNKAVLHLAKEWSKDERRFP